MKTKLIYYFKIGLWQEPEKIRGRIKDFMIRQLRIVTIAVSSFSKDKIQMRASALTLYSLLSIVPLLATAFGITKGFGLDRFLQEYLVEKFSQHQEILHKAIIFANNMLANIKGGFIAGAGIVVLLWSVIKILGNIENAFNHIWRIQKSRSLYRKISDYCSLALVALIFVVISSSLKVKPVMNFIQNSFLTSYLAPAIRIGFWLLSYSLIWLLFVLFYVVLTNTKIKPGSAFFGGIIAGTLFHFLQWFYFIFQGLLSGYGAIYGSFAALPLFLIWLQFSWLIVLWGAECAFAHQNIKTFINEKNTTEMSYYNQRLLALLVCREVIRGFIRAESAKTVAEIAETIKAPVLLIQKCISTLQKAGILSEIVLENDSGFAYQPALDTERISVSFIIDKLDKFGQDSSIIGKSEVSDALLKIINSFYNDLETSPENKLLKDI